TATSSFDVQDVLVKRFKSSFQISNSNWVFEKNLASKYSLRLPQLEYTRFPRAANEPPCPGEGYAGVARKGRFSPDVIDYALRGLIEAFPPAGVSPIPLPLIE